MTLEKSLLGIIKWGAVLIVLVVPLLYFNSTMYPYLTLKTVVFQAMVEILLALWLTLIIFYPQFRPKITLLGVAMIVFVLVLFLTSLLGVNFWKSFWSLQSRLTGLFLIVHFAVLYFILSAIPHSFWRWIWWGSLIAASVGSVGAFLEKSFIHDLFSSRDFNRASSLFGNPSFLAGYLILNVFVGLMLIYGEKQKWAKLLAGVFSAMCVFGVLLTQTIGALLALFVGLTAIILYFIFFTSISGYWRKVCIGFLLFLIISPGFFWLTKESFFWSKIPGLSRIATIDLAGNLKNRLIAWKSGWQAFKERPLIGWGWDNFNVGFNKYFNPILVTANFSEAHWDKPHNLFLEYLYSTGLLGFIAFLFLFSAVFYQGWRVRSATFFLLIGLIAYLIQALVLFDSIGVYLMLAFYFAYINNQYKLTGN